MKLFRAQTKAERVSGIDGLTLFFGALLGANLGTIQEIPLDEYIKMILLLSGAVITIRLVSMTDRKSGVLWTVLLFVALLLALAFVPALQPDGVKPEALHRVLVTIGIWLGAVLLIEYWPHETDAPDSHAKDAQASPTAP